MAVDIPAPFDLLSTNNWRNAASIGAPTSETAKTAGGIRITQNGWEWDAAPVGAEEGVIFDLNGSATAEDWTDKLFLVSHTFNAQNRMQFDTLANNGLSFWAYSTVESAYEKFVVGGNDTARGKFGNGHMCMVIDLMKIGHESGGSFDYSNFIGYGVAVTRLDIAGSNSNWNYISRATQMGHTKSADDIPRIYGTSVNLSDLHDTVETSSYSTVEHNYTTRLGNVYEYNCPFAIGDFSQSGGTNTTFDDNGITVVSPPDDNSADPRFQLTNRSMRVYIDLRNNSADTATWSGTYVWGTRAPWDFGQADSAIVTLSSPTFRGMGSFDVGSSVSGDATWDDVDSVVLTSTSADVDGSTISNSFATPIDYAYQDDNGVFTDYTTEAQNTTGTNDVVLYPATPAAGTDRFYFGKTVEFTEIEIDISTAGAGTYTIAYEYWDGPGQAWTSLTVTDGTSNFKTSGLNSVTFTQPADWQATTVNSQEAFWIRAEIQSGTVTTVPLAESIDLDNAGGLVLPGAMTLSNVTFSNNNRALEVTATGSYTLSGCTFSGNTIMVRNTSDGAVTLNLTNSTTSILSTDVENTGAGTTTINNLVTQTVTVTDVATGSGIPGVSVAIYQSSDDTNTLNETTDENGTATDATFNYTVDTAVYFRVRQSTTQATFNSSSGVDGVGEDITTDANHNFEDGEAVVYSRDGGSANMGLTDGTTYYVHDIGADNISMHTSAANAIADTSRVPLNSTGGETHLLTPKRYLPVSGTATITSSGLTLNVSLREDTTAA